MSNINDPETVCARCLVRDQSLRALSSDLKALREAAARLCAVLTPGALNDEEADARAALIALLPLRALQAVLATRGVTT